MFHQAIVEDNVDPLKLGRVKIRIVGKHPKNRSDSSNKNEYMSVDDLPWAIPSFPITSPMISGEGGFSIPNNGSVVLCGFLDDDDQHPFYFGVIPKIPEAQPDFNEGFSDPNSEYPKSDYLNMSPIPKNAQEIELKTTTAFKTEPNLGGPGTYPFNKAIQTKSGHVLELDDTDGSERICIYHKTGTAIEMNSAGHIIMRGNDKVYLAGKGEVQIEGATEDINIDGAITEDAASRTTTMSGAITETAASKSTTTSGNISETSSGGTITLTASGAVTIQGSSVILKGAVTTLTVV